MAKRGVGIDKTRLGQARAELGLTQQELADRVGVHRVTLGHIESGKACSLELLEKLCLELGRSREWLTGQPEELDRVALAREALGVTLMAVEESVGNLVDLMDELTSSVRERVAAEQAQQDEDAVEVVA